MITTTFHTDPGSKSQRRKSKKARVVADPRKDTKVTTKVTKRRPSLTQTIRLKNWHELESWQQDNEFLHSGYRSISNSYLRSLHSLTYIHNQTANIYSHLLGALLFLASYLFIHFEVVPRYKTADVYDVICFGMFFGGALGCFGVSAWFHTVGNHSHGVYERWLLWDLYGILGLISGTVWGGTGYGFYCERSIWLAYSIGITVITILGGIICTIPRFRAPKWRFVRAVLFGCILLSGAVPMTHAANAFGREQAAKQMGWWWLVVEACMYVIGALIYATRFPECLKPGAFDIWGNSHQVFHVFAVLGAGFHLVGMIKAFDYNHNPATRRC